MKPSTRKQPQKKTVNLAPARHPEQRGFTLIETVISLLILMVVGLGAASLFVVSATNNTGARDRQLSMAVAQQQLERLRGASFANLRATVTNGGGSDKTVTNAGRPYRVVTTIVDTTSSLKTITVQVTTAAGPGWGGTTTNFGGVTIVTQRAANTFGPNR